MDARPSYRWENEKFIYPRPLFITINIKHIIRWFGVTPFFLKNYTYIKQYLVNNFSEKRILLLKSRQSGKSYMNSMNVLKKHLYELRNFSRCQSIKKIFNI